jgi:hypothetical protein
VTDIHEQEKAVTQNPHHAQHKAEAGEKPESFRQVTMVSGHIVPLTRIQRLDINSANLTTEARRHRENNAITNKTSAFGVDNFADHPTGVTSFS